MAGCLAGITLMGVAPPAGDVWPNLHALPNRTFLDTVQTRIPQTVDVTVTRGAVVVAHIVSRPDSARALAHRIAIPPLPGGLYDVQLKSNDATATQHLSVSTISVVIARGATTNVLMAFDLRTLRQRRDVRAIVATARGSETISPSSDGLIRAPSGMRARVTASDGSTVELSARRFDPTGPWYLQTDREVYRPADRVRYRFISKRPSAAISGDFGVRIASTNHVGWGSFVIPRQTVPGRYLRDTITVSGSSEPPYRIEAAPWPYEAVAREPTAFVVSATNPDGSPAAGLVLRYNANVLGAPRETRLDASGNAMLWVIAPYRQDLDFSVYEPGTQRIAAESWAHSNWQKEMIGVYAPMLANPNTCYAIAVTRQDAHGNLVPNQPLTFEASLMPRPLLDVPGSIQHLVTGPGGLAIARWCAPEDARAYRFTVKDNPPGQLQGIGWMQINDNLQNAQEQIWAFPDRSQTSLGVPVNVTATSVRDADALVAAGSPNDPHVFVVPFREGVAHFLLAPRSEADEVEAKIEAGTPGGEAPGNVFVAVRPQRHRLAVSIGCLRELARICVRVANAGGHATPARLFIDVDPTTLAAVLSRQTGLLPELAYSAVFAVTPWPAVSTPWGGGLLTPPVSYLYPSAANAAARVLIVRANTPPHSEPMPSLPPLVWLNDVPTDRRGTATMRLSPSFVAGRLYSVHVIAVNDDGDVGEAYAWYRTKRMSL